MNILVVYGTTEGQTRKIASFMSDRIRDRGGNVTLIDSTDFPKDLDVDGFDAEIAAGSVHNGRHQAALFQFTHDQLAALQTRPTASSRPPTGSRPSPTRSQAPFVTLSTTSSKVGSSR